MEGEVCQDAQQGKCQADREKCHRERRILRRRSRYKDNKATRRVGQRGCREQGAQQRSEVDVQECRRDRGGRERER